MGEAESQRYRFQIALPTSVTTGTPSCGNNQGSKAAQSSDNENSYGLRLDETDDVTLQISKSYDISFREKVNITSMGGDTEHHLVEVAFEETLAEYCRTSTS